MDDLRQNDGVVANVFDGDSPIFDPVDWRLSDFEAALCAETRSLAAGRFAARAPELTARPDFRPKIC